MAELRFLAVRLGSLGDIVHTFPAVAALRETFPAAEIVWLTHPRWKMLVESSDLANGVWTVETRALGSVREVLKRIRTKFWTAAIDYQGLWKSAALPFLAGVQRRIGFSSETIREFGVPVLYTDRVRVSSHHICERNGELSRRAGAAHRTAEFALRAPAASATTDTGRYVVLSPGGGWRSKCWPAQRYGELCAALHNQLGVPCVINCGPGEESLFQAIAEASAPAKPQIYSGDLGALMGLLKYSTCVVGGDTGPLHLAAALGVRTVALFGPTDPARNGPFPAQKSVVLRSACALTTYKRGRVVDSSLIDLCAEDVFAAVRRQTEAGPPS